MGLEPPAADSTRALPTHLPSVALALAFKNATLSTTARRLTVDDLSRAPCTAASAPPKGGTIPGEYAAQPVIAPLGRGPFLASRPGSFLASAEVQSDWPMATGGWVHRICQHAPAQPQQSRTTSPETTGAAHGLAR
jgi:hypothetical protein